MSFDFKLNNRGDILFKYSYRETSSLQFDFFTSPVNGLVFDFYIDSYTDNSYLPDLIPLFAFQFCIDTPAYDKEIVSVSDDEEYIYQQIKIRLDSALGSIKNNENIGSELDRYRHMLLNPNKDIDFTELKACVEKAIKDIIPDAVIDIFVKDTIFIDFTNSLIITINKDDFNYYYYL